MHLKIQCNDSSILDLYKNHKPPHPGDAGFDLFCMQDVTVGPGETVAINLGIRASAHRSQRDSENSIPFWITPRSSISKTPLRLANSGTLLSYDG